MRRKERQRAVVCVPFPQLARKCYGLDLGPGAAPEEEDLVSPAVAWSHPAAIRVLQPLGLCLAALQQSRCALAVSQHMAAFSLHQKDGSLFRSRPTASAVGCDGDCSLCRSSSRTGSANGRWSRPLVKRRYPSLVRVEHISWQRVRVQFHRPTPPSSHSAQLVVCV